MIRMHIDVHAGLKKRGIGQREVKYLEDLGLGEELLQVGGSIGRFGTNQADIAFAICSTTW